MKEIIAVIIIFGCFGGVVNYFMKDENELNIYKFFRSVFIGLAAAFLVPLFLNMISSNLIAEIDIKKSNLLIFAGFCLIASISSKAFIDSVSKKIINELNNKIKDINEEVKPIIEKETETDEPPKKELGNEENTSTILFNPNDSKRVKLLRTLYNGKYTYRSLNGIISDLNMNSIVVNKILNHLISNDYVAQITGKNGMRFYITSKGREFINKYDTDDNNNTYEEIIEKKYLKDID